MRANWCKRVLFLADRVALVRQAHNAFKMHLPSAPSANLIQAHDPQKNNHHAARVCLSTYPTMMNLIDEMENGQRRFGPGHFDLIVIDEAHRSIYRKYRSIFDYFDSLLVGLTPRRATRSIAIPIRYSSLSAVSQPTLTISTRPSRTSSWSRRVPFQWRCGSCGRGSSTTNFLTKKRRSGMRWNGRVSSQPVMWMPPLSQVALQHGYGR